ncbi:DNA-directed RNA polymerase subunit H [Candidatus Woesearchaeota archaeon]|nr:DNA-directed RNA polymerase subunit H [Candidatus Woesearchaeota archaeon]
MAKKVDITNHVLVPKHVKLSEKEKNEILEKYKITLSELPRISINDPAIKDTEITTKDVVKIIRESPTAKETVYYRRVVK